VQSCGTVGALKGRDRKRGRPHAARKPFAGVHPFQLGAEPPKGKPKTLLGSKGKAEGRIDTVRWPRGAKKEIIAACTEEEILPGIVPST